MFRSFNITKTFILLSFLCLPTFLSANPVGQVVGVVQNATIEQAGRTKSLQKGQTVAVGDVITTEASGEVQLLFQDKTKIAISSNSRLVIENILFNSSNTASTFAVTAVGGAFRFFSGNSEKSAYSINTPNGTMGIRGTTFDFNVFPTGELGLVTFRGEVRLCNRFNRCARVSGGCAAVLINSSGEFVVPKNSAEKDDLLERGFPYVKKQKTLRREYLAPISACASQAAGAEPTPTPSPPQKSNVGGAHAGNGISSGQGGSSANDADAGAGGPSGPGDSNAGAGGASAGGAGAGGAGASAGSN